MTKRMTCPAARVLSICLVLALLALVTGFSSAQTRNATTFFAQEVKLTASDGAAGDTFGGAVSISGDILVVSAPWDDDNGAYSGSVYLFERDSGGTGDWVETAKLTATDGAAEDLFGGSVSISGETVVIGARYDDDGGIDTGSAYVFERDPEFPHTDWIEVAKLAASDGSSEDYFGGAVSISGDTIVVGATGDDYLGIWSGSAYLFEKPEDGWAGNLTETVKLTASDGASYDQFGASVSISGDTAIVGAFLDTNDGGDGAGSVYLFERDGGGSGNWGEVAKLTASDGAEGDRFGFSVSISGDTLVVGAARDRDSGTDSGSAYVFEKAGFPETWDEVAKLTASDGAEGDYFGCGASISGDTVVICAYGDDDNGSFSGSAYTFERPVAGWIEMTETAKLTASDGASDDWFGQSVSISGGTLVVGAPYHDGIGDDSGSVYVFDPFEPIAWIYLPVVLRSAP